MDLNKHLKVLLYQGMNVVCSQIKSFDRQISVQELLDLKQMHLIKHL